MCLFHIGVRELQKPDQRSTLSGFAIYSTLLSYLIGPPLVGLWIGKSLDAHFATAPLCLVIGLLLGLGAGLYGMIHFVRDFTGDEEK